MKQRVIWSARRSVELPSLIIHIGAICSTERRQQMVKKQTDVCKRSSHTLYFHVRTPRIHCKVTNTDWCVIIARWPEAWPGARWIVNTVGVSSWQGQVIMKSHIKSPPTTTSTTTWLSSNPGLQSFRDKGRSSWFDSPGSDSADTLQICYHEEQNEQYSGQTERD